MNCFAFKMQGEIQQNITFDTLAWYVQPIRWMFGWVLRRPLLFQTKARRGLILFFLTGWAIGKRVGSFSHSQEKKFILDKLLS